MATRLKRLVRKVVSTHAKDVARLRALLNKNGYDADDLEIEAAYIAWSRSLPRPSEWHSLSYMTNEATLLKVLLDVMIVEPEQEFVETPIALHTSSSGAELPKESNRAEASQKQDDRSRTEDQGRGRAGAQSVARLREEKRRRAGKGKESEVKATESAQVDDFEDEDEDD